MKKLKSKSVDRFEKSHSEKFDHYTMEKVKELTMKDYSNYDDYVEVFKKFLYYFF